LYLFFFQGSLPFFILYPKAIERSNTDRSTWERTFLRVKKGGKNILKGLKGS
jgi:hypothetical protein